VDFEKEIAKYISYLDPVQKESFAPQKQLISNSLNGFDLQVIVLVNKGEQPTASNINALAIFNQEANAVKTSNGTSQLKIALHHISTIEIK
jgi:hypothetical protein